MLDWRPTRSLLAAGLLLLAACVPGASAVQKRGAADLNCPVKDVQVVRLDLMNQTLLGTSGDEALYEAKGCGKRMEYWIKGRNIRPHHGEFYSPQ